MGLLRSVHDGTFTADVLQFPQLSDGSLLQLRLALIGFGGLLTRMKFYLQIMPMYTFFKWIVHSYNTRSKYLPVT